MALRQRALEILAPDSDPPIDAEGLGRESASIQFATV
jgi:hypothetical protein